jgi:hypothetical protein
VECDDANGGFNLSGFFGVDNVIWYPLTGYIGDGGKFHQSTFQSFVRSLGDEMYMYNGGKTYGTRITLDYSTSDTNAASVRCQKVTN